MDEYGSTKEVEQIVVSVGITTTKPGDATHFPVKGQTCRVHYEAFLSSDGSKFDSSRDRGLPFEFVLGEGHVVPGWEKTVPKMSLVSRLFQLIALQMYLDRFGVQQLTTLFLRLQR